MSFSTVSPVLNPQNMALIRRKAAEQGLLCDKESEERVQALFQQYVQQTGVNVPWTAHSAVDYVLLNDESEASSPSFIEQAIRSCMNVGFRERSLYTPLREVLNSTVGDTLLTYLMSQGRERTDRQCLTLQVILDYGEKEYVCRHSLYQELVPFVGDETEEEPWQRLEQNWGKAILSGWSQAIEMEREDLELVFFYHVQTHPDTFMRAVLHHGTPHLCTVFFRAIELGFPISAQKTQEIIRFWLSHATTRLRPDECIEILQKMSQASICLGPSDLFTLFYQAAQHSHAQAWIDLLWSYARQQNLSAKALSDLLVSAWLGMMNDNSPPRRLLTVQTLQLYDDFLLLKQRHLCELIRHAAQHPNLQFLIARFWDYAMQQGASQRELSDLLGSAWLGAVHSFSRGEMVRFLRAFEQQVNIHPAIKPLQFAIRHILKTDYALRDLLHRSLYPGVLSQRERQNLRMASSALELYN